MMKYKVGDVVKANASCGWFEEGEVLTIIEIDEDFNVPYLCEGVNEQWWLPIESISGYAENKPAADLSLSVDIPTEAMKEFADHCERAAAALERIKDILA